MIGLAGNGVLADGVIGDWFARAAGMGGTLDPVKIKTHLLAVYENNFKSDLSAHPNPQRPGYAYGDEPGLLLCTWPAGWRPSLPFVYCDEV